MRKAFYFYGNPIKTFFMKNHCPFCDHQLSLITHHQFINSKSEEAKRYQSLFETNEGGALLGNFNVDIRHKVFYCPTCQMEIEPPTLHSFQKVQKQISKLIKLSKSKNMALEVIYQTTQGESSKINPSFFEKAILKATSSQETLERSCFIAKQHKNDEQATYFEKTYGLKEIRKFMKKDRSPKP